MNKNDYDKLIDLIDDLRGMAYDAGMRQHGLEMIDRDSFYKLREICGMSQEDYR
jgi:hypothetical protein